MHTSQTVIHTTSLGWDEWILKRIKASHYYLSQSRKMDANHKFVYKDDLLVFFTKIPGIKRTKLYKWIRNRNIRTSYIENNKFSFYLMFYSLLHRQIFLHGLQRGMGVQYFSYWGTPMHLFHIACATMPTKQVALLCYEWIIFFNDISLIGCQIQMPWTYLISFPLSLRVNFNDISIVGSVHSVLARLK